MGRTTVETGPDERLPYGYEVSRALSPSKDIHGDISPTPKDERHVQPWSNQEDTEKIGLRTLGDGPLAPGAAGEAAQAEAEQNDDDKEVHPGTKGWLNLVGVSRPIQLESKEVHTNRSGRRCEYAVL